MSRQPYIYTLPEQFIEDKSVPAHWKLYTIINGFWLSGREVFASNQFFAEKLGCGERNIRVCLEKLEALGLVERVGLSQRRRIIPGGGTGSAGQGGTHSSEGAEPTVPHISDSISEREEGAFEDEQRVVFSPPDSEEERLPKGKRLAKAEKERLEPLVRWAENERGFPFLSTEQGKQLKALSLAKENGIKAAELRERWEDMSSDKFWSEKGYDWMNVVKSFNTKRA